MDTYERYIGQTLDRRYYLLRIIGVGGMAVVYEGMDTGSGRHVAVKMLKDEYANDSASVYRFVNESKAIAALNHPNIVKIYDVSVTGSAGPKYIVMELVEGVTLKGYMNRTGALPAKEILSYAEQILKALEQAHSKGIIHRDIKPQNIMLLRSGRIKVTDFGIAKMPNADTITVGDKAIGTVYYISPEQASGQKIDARSDLYSLGVMMYEMATGQLPFTGDTPVSVALMQVNDDPVPPRDINPRIPVGLEQIILGAMEKAPDRRFQTAEQMLKYVRTLQDNPKFIFKEYRDSGVSRFSGRVQGTIAGKRESHTMLPVILGVASAFLIVALTCAIFIWNALTASMNENQPKSIQIPNFIGTMYTFDMTTEYSNYYNITVEYEYDPDTPENQIIDQTPAAGERRKVKAGEQRCDLKLTVSRGAETIRLPDLTIYDAREAVNYLKDLGLNAKNNPQRISSPTIPAGYVISTEPQAGTIMNAGDVVVLTISKGEEVQQTTVPNMVGKTTSEAYSMLTSAGLKLGDVTYRAGGAAGTIASQSLNHSSMVPAGSPIDLVVYSG
ncbi:MAG: protein kinase [Clostridia bacterium]|nr:protein kinase [Clostridia bacterium]